MFTKYFRLRLHYLFIPLLITFLLFVLSFVLIFLPIFEHSIKERKKELIKEITITAWNTVDFYNQKYDKGELTLEQAKKQAIKHIENIRYGQDDKDYFWINDYQPKMIMHPYLTNLIGRDLSDFKDPDGKYLFNEIVDVVKSKEEGYVRYKWQLRDDSTLVLPKISFVKAFKPWKWIIGTGVYLTDIEQDVRLLKQKMNIIFLIIALVILSIFSYIFFRGVKKEKLLIEAETKYQKLFEFSNDAIILLRNDIIIDCNTKALELLECKKQNIVNHSILNFSPEFQPSGKKSKDQAQKIIKDCINGESQFFEWVHLTHHKKPFIAEVSLSSVNIHNEIFLMSSIRDITQRKKDEKKIIEARKRAENADKLKSVFLANMSHEIRTPMNAILGFSQLIKNSRMSEEKRNEFINIIHSKGNQLLQIINDIIDISKIESNQIKLYPTKFSVNKMIDELYQSYKSAGQETIKPEVNFKVKKELPDNQSFIYSDRTRIIQILSNLLNNAFKYTEKGFVELGYKIKTSQIEFYVKDTGIGVQKEKKEIIFERFRQADESSTRTYGGTGLGLSISKGLVQILEGSLNVDSDGKSGSCFYFTIPYNSVSADI
ncbi:MAG: cache domain-containing protein [Thiohalospira sp.]